MNGRKQEIKKPYGDRELLLDIIIGAQAGIIYAQAFMEDADAGLIIITAIMAALMTAILHIDITSRWNRRMYLQNKRRRKARRIYIQAQRKKTTKGA